MRFNEFKKRMLKPVFTWREACHVAWQTSPPVLRLDIFNWKKREEIQMLKRGLYCFPDRVQNKTEIARYLHTPCYISLEWALHYHGLLPDVAFSLTLVSTRGSRKFETPYGEFIYHQMKSDLFWGFDPDTLMAEREKAVLDYFYLKSAQMIPKPEFWEEMRWQNLELIEFEKMRLWSKKFGIHKIELLVQSLEEYAKIE